MKGLALVTGAGGGLGLAFAEGLARRGYDLVLISLPGEDLAGTAERLMATFGIQCLFVEGDLTLTTFRQQVFDLVAGMGSPIQVLVNNAGLGSTGPFLEFPTWFYERQITLNCIVPVVLTRELFPLLAKTGKGHVLMVSSMGAFLHVPGKAVYDATKAFLIHFSRSLHPVVVKENIHLCVTCPGPINTNDRLRKAHAQMKGISRKLVMEPSDVAEESLDALFRGKRSVIPGKWNRFFHGLQSMMPDLLVQNILKSRIRG